MSTPKNPRLFESYASQSGPAYDSSITLRDLFAVQALSGLITSPDYSPVGWNVYQPKEGTSYNGQAAKEAYDIADALLAERAKRSGE